jgi:hypothetical protein
MADDDWTCGKGLAANAALPEAMGTFFDAMATVLELHTRALDLSQSSGRTEYEAYVQTVVKQRAIALSLATLSREMANCVDLPMAEHDMAVLSGHESTTAFQVLVKVEKALLAQLDATVDEHQRMLAG